MHETDASFRAFFPDDCRLDVTAGDELIDDAALNGENLFDISDAAKLRQDSTGLACFHGCGSCLHASTVVQVRLSGQTVDQRKI